MFAGHCNNQIYRDRSNRQRSKRERERVREIDSLFQTRSSESLRYTQVQVIYSRIDNLI
jgi:hypothetical protein